MVTTLADLPDDVTEYEATVYRDSFRQFVSAFWGDIPVEEPFVGNWHIDFLCRELEKVAWRVRDGLPREYDLVVNVPFGTSKSSLISILFPAWVWTFFPQARFISATHTEDLALDLASKSKNVITGEKYRGLYPHVRLKKDTEGYFTNTRGGDRMTCTVGGKTPTGFHAHFLIPDDPIDPQGVRSEVELDTAAKFMTEVIPSRKVDKEVAVMVLVMQRLEFRDPSAVMLKLGQNPDVTPVRHVCFPGELADNLSPPLDEIRQTYPDAYLDDDLFDPKRLPRRVLAEYKARLGNAYYAQVQQQPMPPGGGMFKLTYFSQRVRSAPYECRRIRYWDRAATLAGGCATAGVLMAKDKDGFYHVEDVVHGHWDPFERNDVIAATALRDRVRYGPKYEPLIIIEAETGSTGKESFQRMAAQLAGYRVREDKPSGSKDVRAEPWSSQCAAGNVRIVDNGESRGLGKATWDVDGYVTEHCLFKPTPGKRVGGLVDRVDASSGAFNLLAGLKTGEGMRVYTIGESRHKGLRVVVCTLDQLPRVLTEHRSLLISVQDPPVTAAESPPTPPAHALTRCLGTLVLNFADLAPQELQDVWHVPLLPWGKKPEDLIMARDDGKRLWAFVLKKRDPGAEVIVIQDDGDHRGLSLAYAVVDVLLQPRNVVHVIGSEDYDHKGKDPPNPHCYATAKLGRGLVVG